MGIADALFTKAQQKVLTILFGQPDKSYYLNEIVRLADIGRGAVSRELARLTEAGLLTRRKKGNQVHYQVNPNLPIKDELISIVRKTFGVKAILEDALLPLQPHLQEAFVYGSVASGKAHAESDIDLMLVGNKLSYSAVIELLDGAEHTLQRKINPTIYTPEEYANRLKKGQSFLTKVVDRDRLKLFDR
ncbi:MAG TPA: nucleotidyltransferase domain-containing protein [Burkholderiaceae bacterium]|nr:nucleotidyltransferase domain-containing protein [Burkholderiaceae bacterium]